MSDGTIVDIGKYKFRIKENILRNRDDEVYCYNFQISGNYSDCVNVSVSYDDKGNPISAKIPTLVYDSECSLAAPLDRGEGTIQIIKALLLYINEKLPTINEFIFEDKSNIECGTEEEKYQKRRRKRGTHAVPIPLYYFSIAFNNITWYEKHFRAYQQDLSLHREYRQRVKALMGKAAEKPSFNDFLRIAQPPVKYIDELEALYKKSSTYGEFFSSMSKDDRCRLVRDWIITFMEYYLKGVFKNTDWVIDVRKMNKTNTNQYGGTRKKSHHSKNYYCPRGHIRLSFEHKDSGSA